MTPQNNVDEATSPSEHTSLSFDKISLMLSLPEFSTRFQRVFLFIVYVVTRIHTARVSLSVKTMNQKRKNITMVLFYA